MGTANPAFEAETLQAIEAAVKSSDLVRAADTATRALNTGMRHPVLFNARALRLEQQGRFEDALMEYRAASLLAPTDPVIHNALGLCLINLNRLDQAVHAFDSAIAHRPSFAPSHYRRGWALGMLGDHERAQAAHERAVALDSFYLDPLTSLASIMCQKGQLAKARYYAESALLLQASAPTAIAAMAMVELAEKSYAAAETHLRPLLQGPDTALKARAFGLLGDALDGQNRTAEAFESYTAGKDLLNKIYLSRRDGPRPLAQEVRRIASYVRTSEAKSWDVTDRNLPERLEGKTPAKHVFLVGFMRSGTTLLEQVLSANPTVKALDERDILGELAKKYLATDSATDSFLKADGEGPLAEARAFYWDNARALAGNVAGKIFLDKLPFNALRLPLIAKLFPDARIVVAIRDPRDVVLSCFRRHLEVSVTPLEFFSLTETAKLYAETMQLIELCRAKMPLAFFDHRYESMIEDFDGRVRAVCDFIGMEFTGKMREFASSAPALALRSPSAPQVRRGLYTEGVDQWRRYTTQMEPTLPLLEPWIAKFAYPAE